MCEGTNMKLYFNNLEDGYQKRNMLHTPSIYECNMQNTEPYYQDGVYPVLIVETGKYKNIPRENRVWSSCDILEDEIMYCLFTISMAIREINFHDI